jgi:tRNA(Ile)-lysidine synthetase-like protein
MQQAFRKISHSSIELGFDLVDKMVAFIHKPNSKSHLTIVSDFEITLENDFLFLHQKGADLPHQNFPCMDPNLLVQLNFPGTGQINKVWSIKADLDTKKNMRFPPSSGQLIYQTFIDAEKITNPLILKCQKQGDRFSPLGLKGKEQKLSDFWINKKIPFRFRSTWPLLYEKDQIAWIPGFQPSHYFQITEGSNRILKVELIRNRD